MMESDSLRQESPLSSFAREQAPAFVASPWTWGIIGAIAFSIGLLFVIRPAKSGEAMWKVAQSLRSYPVTKAPVGVSVAFGCLCLLIAVAAFGTAWWALAQQGR